jgi:hypothetical protein
MGDCDFDIVFWVPGLGFIADQLKLSPVFGIYDLISTTKQIRKGEYL